MTTTATWTSSSRATPGFNPVAKVYRNEGGVFVAIGAALTGVSYSSVAWGDYDNDGDLDILLTGATGSPVTRLYRNEECADLAVVKAVTPPSAAPGAAITYTLRFTNTGPGSARGVVLRDSIPVSVTISRVTSSTVGSGVRITQTSAGPNFAWAVSDLAVGGGRDYPDRGARTLALPATADHQHRHHHRRRR